MRLFLAVDLPHEARQALAAEQKRIAASLIRGGSPLRLVPPERMHLTLVFVANADETQAAAICEAASRDVDMTAFHMTLRGFGAFPPRGAPRVLWMGVDPGAQELIRLQQIMAGRISDAGVPLDRRPFSPHLTLGRWRQARSSVRSALEPVPSSGQIARFDVRRVTLFQSRLSPNGPTYVPLAHANLVGKMDVLGARS